jgi:GntR family transcriptional regulator
MFMPESILQMISIDRRSKADYATQIKENIKGLILDKTFYYRTQLPAIKRLSTYLDIDQKYVQKAYKQLITERYIKQEQSSYQVIYIELTNYFFERNTSIYDAVITLGLSPSIRCLEKKVVSLSKTEMNRMGFDPKQENKYLYINRIYYGDDQPIIILENYLPLYVFPKMDEIFLGDEPLNHFIGEQYGFKAYRSKRITKVVNLSETLANLLNERVNAASIQSTNQVFDEEGRMIDFGQSHSISSYYFQALGNIDVLSLMEGKN